MELSVIKDKVMNVAEAITAALEIETEIINGQHDPKEGERAEICCPIRLENRFIGLIGLVAFNEEQREKIKKSRAALTLFLERMAELIASKLSETEKRNQLEGILEFMHEGLITIDRSGVIQSCNYESERLLGLKRSQMEGRILSEIWALKEAEGVVKNSTAVRDKEVFYRNNNQEKRFHCTIIPLSPMNDGVQESASQGAMILFQNISDIRERMYKMTAIEKYTAFQDIIGESEPILRAKKRTQQVSASDSTILITGESGTGKELFARAIHSESPRKTNPFVAINCGAIPEMLLESELFGYEKGAFTGADARGKPGKFEIAHKGTIFLDEIGDLPLHLQVKLLHAIQNRRIDRVGGTSPIDIDVRIIAATNKNLEQMIASQEFREDLYFRLNVIPIQIPPLRDREGDIELLLRYTLEKFNKRLGKNIRDFSSEALMALINYSWPGNVRELENVVEYAVNMETGSEILPENLPDKILKRQRNFNQRVGLKEKLDEYQKMLIEECLDETGRSTEDKIIAATRLGISESTLYRRIRELGI